MRGEDLRGEYLIGCPVIRPISLKPGPVAHDQLIACLVCVCVCVCVCERAHACVCACVQVVTK